MEKERLNNEIYACLERHIIKAEKETLKELNELGIRIDNIMIKADVKIYFNENFYSKIKG